MNPPALSMNTPLSVVFDIGKVLLDFDYSIAARKHSAKANKTAEEIFELMNSDSALLAEYETGLMSSADFFAPFPDGSGYTGTFDDFQSPFAEGAVAADDLAFIDRIWEDWSPAFDGGEWAPAFGGRLDDRDWETLRAQLFPDGVRAVEEDQLAGS